MKNKHPGSDLQLIFSSLNHTVLVSYLILAETYGIWPHFNLITFTYLSYAS